MNRFLVRSLAAISFVFSCAPVWATVTGWVAVKTALYEQNADNVQPTQATGWNFNIHVEGDDGVVITFLDNGIYYLVHASSFGEGPGMERGIYTWDPNTGAFSAMATVDTTPGYGLDTGTATPGKTGIINGNIAHFTVPGDGEFDMYCVIDTECSDLDADGLPDVFEMQISGNPTNAVPGGNSDGDDLTDREEFIAGTLPGDGASIFVVSNAPPSPAGPALTWNAFPAASTRSNGPTLWEMVSKGWKPISPIRRTATPTPSTPPNPAGSII